MTTVETIHQSLYGKHNPFLAQILERKRLSRGINKNIWHLEIDIEGSEYNYAPGDSLGIYPQNNPDLVNQLIQKLQWDPSVSITLTTGHIVTGYEALINYLDIHHISRKLLDQLHTHTSDPAEKATLASLLDPEAIEALKQYLKDRDLLDIVEAFPHACAALTPAEFPSILRRLLPRLYSIASAPTIHPNQIHLTLSVVRYTLNDRMHEGIASTYLAERMPLNEPLLRVFIAPSHFRLPKNPHADVIMIGPGTGVAPFRAFMQERAAQAHTGRSWLFFGDQHRETDFLYESEWNQMLQSGSLYQLDVAFSRDQAFKVYVQHVMEAKKEQLWKWIESGAHIYVCGDAKQMAPDVDKTLNFIIQDQGSLSESAASDYIKALKQQKRYQRDIY